MLQLIEPIVLYICCRYIAQLLHLRSIRVVPSSVLPWSLKGMGRLATLV